MKPRESAIVPNKRLSPAFCASRTDSTCSVFMTFMSTRISPMRFATVTPCRAYSGSDPMGRYVLSHICETTPDESFSHCNPSKLGAHHPFGQYHADTDGRSQPFKCQATDQPCPFRVRHSEGSRRVAFVKLTHPLG